MRTMLAAAPFRWTDPATWPWMFYVWLAFIFAGWSFPAWRWLRRKRAAGWPVADGRIESVKVSNRRLSFTVNRSYYFAELGYSYSVAGALNSNGMPDYGDQATGTKNQSVIAGFGIAQSQRILMGCTCGNSIAGRPRRSSM